MKKFIHKIKSWILVLSMILSTLHIEMTHVHAQNDFVLSLNSMITVAGEEIEVEVSISDNPGLISLLFDIEYDSNVLKLESVTDTNQFGESIHSDLLTLNPYRLNWSNDTASKNFDYNGVLAVLKFKVLDSAPEGNHDIRITYNLDDAPFVDYDLNLYEPTTINGIITVHKHDMVKHEYHAPTCEDTGNSEYYSCDICGKYFSDIQGKNEIQLKDTVLPSTGHSHTKVVTPPTCTEKGYTTYTCKCGDTYKADYVDALGHTYGEWTQTKAPTCTTKGQEQRNCKNCTHYETREVTATGHSHTKVVTPPTCTEQGYTTYTCKCGDTYKADYVDEVGHSYGEWTQTKAPTCTTKGQEQRNCKNCAHYETRDVAATGHSHTKVVTAPTCTEKGYTTYTCKCGDTYKADYVNALGHSYGEWTITKAPTCTTKGQEQRNCKNCTHKETREIEATGHSHTKVVTAPTCTEKGYTTYTCKCGDTYKADFVDELGHLFTNYISDNNATYAQDGTKTAKCDRCDATHTVVDAGSRLVLYGDVNDDGRVNQLDRIILARYLAKWEGYGVDRVNLKNADTNADGLVNQLDRVILSRHLANWPTYDQLPK